MVKWVYISLCFFFGISASANHFEFTQNCHQAYKAIIGLRLEEGSHWVEREKQQNPSNYMVHLLEDYIDFFTLYITEDEARYYELQKNRRKRLKLVQKGDKNSPYYLYTIAEIHIHWAITRLKFEEYLGAFSDIKKAYSLLSLNKARHPDFIFNNKSLAVFHAVIGAIPEKYRWGVELMGMKGSIETGMAELDRLIEYSETNTYPFLEETVMLSAFLNLHLLKKPGKAWEMVDQEEFLNDDNLLNYFIKASVAMHSGKNDEAILILQNRPESTEFIEFHFMEFLVGLAKLRKLEKGAGKHLEYYIQNFKGKNYIKEAYQKLSWEALLNNDTVSYYHYRDKVKSEGSRIIDPDKAAYKEAKNGEIPNSLLLRARLYYDGGYYTAGLNLLKGLSVENFDRQVDKIEFTYRAGRLFQAIGNIEQSKGFYYATLLSGSDSPYYFPASAALQLGLIFEEEKDYERSRYYFKKCIKFKDHVYSSGTESQAKAGLNRIKKLDN